MGGADFRNRCPVQITTGNPFRYIDAGLQLSPLPWLSNVILSESASWDRIQNAGTLMNAAVVIPILLVCASLPAGHISIPCGKHSTLGACVSGAALPLFGFLKI